MPNRDVLNFITSGRMSGLRELSIAVDYKDWVSNMFPIHIERFFSQLILSASLSPTSASDTTPSLPQHPLHCGPRHVFI